MPDHRAQYVQLLVLLLALPAQYLLTCWSGANNETVRATRFQDMMGSVKQTVASAQAIFLSAWNHFSKVSVFRLDFKRLQASRRKAYLSSSSPDGESIATEVFQYWNADGHFARSTVIRSPRPKAVKFRVGQVIRHRVYGYRGVIIGWDQTCKAPKSWIEGSYGTDTAKQDIPHYLVLVDERDRADNRPTYVVQDHLVTVTNVVVRHPKLWDYFQLYDGAQFSMRPAMNHMYPHD